MSSASRAPSQSASSFNADARMWWGKAETRMEAFFLIGAVVKSFIMMVDV